MAADRGTSGWQRDDPPGPAQPALRADTEADIVIVGAGLAGLALAHQAARLVPAASILVLEQGYAGQGATGRSTGIVGPGVGGPITGLVKRFGPEVAGRMFGASLAGIDAMRRLVKALPRDCELTDGYQLVAAAAAGHAGRLRRQAGVLRELGFDVAYLDREATAGRLGTARYHGALCYPDVALLNPWLLGRALRAGVLAAGVRLAEQTPVTEITAGDPVTLRAGAHRVRARVVALAIDGFTPALRLYRRQVATIRTHVLRTEVLPAELLASSGWDGTGAVIDSRSFFNYFRLTARRRLLFGGGPAILDDRVTGRDVVAVGERLRRELRAVLPAFADVPVDELWSGITASTFDRLPIVGPVPHQPGVWFAGAWCGHGLSLSALTAELLAPRLAGAAEWPAAGRDLPWLRPASGPMPSGRLGSLVLAGYLRGLDAGDRLAQLRSPG